MQAPFADPLLTLEQFKTPLPLFGREQELLLLQSLLHTVKGDLPGARALTISGEVGIGKTRLLAELCLEAGEYAFTVLKAAAYEATSQFPYFPFIEALRPVLNSASSAELRRYVGLTAMPSETASAEMQFSITRLARPLSQLFPELPERLHMKLEHEVSTELLTPDQEKFRLFDAIATLLERMALERPILLCIDNLQWADGASLELTLYLTVRLRASRVALVGTTRPPRIISDIMTSANVAAKALGELVRGGLLQLLPLGPLSEDAASQHLRALLPGQIESEVTIALLERSEGNPFFLEELVRALTLLQRVALREGVWVITRTGSMKLPDSIIVAICLRLSSLSASCLTLLGTAALMGRSFPIEPLGHALSQGEEVLRPLLEEALEASLIMPYDPEREDTTGTFQYYLFCQSIVQEVLQMELTSQQRRHLHSAIGHALEECYGNMAQAHAAELAHHYALSDEQEATLRWSLLAGEDAMRQQAQREAINHFMRALKLLATRADNQAAQAELRLTIGSLWSMLGELEQALRSFQQAQEHLLHIAKPPPLLQARTNRLISDAYRMQARYELALAHLQAASDALERLKQNTMESGSDTEHNARQVAWFPGRSFALFTPHEQANTTEYILCLQSRGLLALMLNQPIEAEQALWQSHRLATTIGDRNGQAFAMHMIGWTLGWGDRIHEAIRLLKGANDLYLSIGDPFRATLGDQALGSIYQVLGDMEHASLHTEQGLERGKRYPLQQTLGLLYWNQGTQALNQGDWESGAIYLQQALREAQATNNARLKPLAIQALGELQFKQGNWQEAEQLFLDAIQAGINTEWHASTLAFYGHFLAVTGRKTLARAQLEHAAALPEPPGISGHFYIPFLAEGYLHLDASEQVATYVEHIRTLRGFTYYGTSVDRILGAIAAHMNAWEAAGQAFEEGLLRCQRAGNAPEEGAIYYEQARMALKSGAPSERIHQLCDQALAIFLRYHMQRSADKVKDLRAGVAELHQQEEAHGTARNKARERPALPDYEHLTKRELEVLCLVADGHTDREVAEVLVISPRTANRHLSNIFVKLDVPGRAAAVAYAIRHGLV